MGYIDFLKEREIKKQNLRETALQEAERLSALLKMKFKYDALYLIGSTLSGRGFHQRSDIDLVIKGLKKEFFLKAFAFLLQNSFFAIDLKPWEELNPDMKARVEEGGRILWEKMH